ncbi:YafY family transcriptional regulator [Bacillus luteolus]|uniref:YafY family transcriptional regulator n=1 Tax=Litchfieldia luteola TaxID=682179 RepID=A0ABR9QKI5_9BACI|nr:YafY family protein [Cytobacillus luteolus]MBE4909018.1 YafY family transcriptional regulator [Cytobacillus luteolus]MBP1941877.1 putative DNA-binding transcriptional regulator YafY [Cytobacillus luteolus]
MNKIDRLMAIVLQLKKRNKLTATELANTFEVTPRTIYRDIQALSEMGIPVIALPGNEGGYSIADHYFIPPVMFTKEEVFSLLLSEQIVNQVEIPGHQRSINTAFLKIKNVLDDETTSKFQHLHKRIIFNIKEQKPSAFDQQPFYLVTTSIEQNKKLALTYFHPKKQELTERKVHPYGLIFEDGLWYIIAFCELRKAERLFAVNRIKHIKLLEEDFSLPHEFELEKHSSQSLYNGDGDTQVILKVSKSLFYIIKDYHQLIASKIVEESDDFYIVSLQTNVPKNYLSFTLRFYDGVEIIRPLSLRNEMISLLTTTLNKYQS